MVWHDLRSERKERTAVMAYGAPVKARPRFAWPWVLAAVVATAIAWGPVALPYFGFMMPKNPPTLTISTGPNLRTKEISVLKTQLRDANGKVDQLQAKLEIANKGLDADRAAQKQRADQLLSFCHSGLLNQLLMLAKIQQTAKQEYAPLMGQTCYTAGCFKKFADAQNALSNATAQLLAIHKKVLEELSLPSGEPGCAPLPDE
jgi:hypothetical protein